MFYVLYNMYISKDYFIVQIIYPFSKLKTYLSLVLVFFHFNLIAVGLRAIYISIAVFVSSKNILSTKFSSVLLCIYIYFCRSPPKSPVMDLFFHYIGWGTQAIEYA